MGAAVSFDLLRPVCDQPGHGSVPTLPEEAQPAPASTEPPVSEEWDGMSVDEGYDPPEELWEDWKDTYADAVGISRWRTL